MATITVKDVFKYAKDNGISYDEAKKALFTKPKAKSFQDKVEDKIEKK